MLCWRWACESRDGENRANLGRRRKPAASRTQAEVRNQQAGQAAAGPATALSTAETELLDPVRERREAVLLAPRELVPNSPQTLPGLLAGWQNGQRHPYLHSIGIWESGGALILIPKGGRRHRRPTSGGRGPRGRGDHLGGLGEWTATSCDSSADEQRAAKKNADADLEEGKRTRR